MSDSNYKIVSLESKRAYLVTRRGWCPRETVNEDIVLDTCQDKYFEKVLLKTLIAKAPNLYLLAQIFKLLFAFSSLSELCLNFVGQLELRILSLFKQRRSKDGL